MADVDYNFTKTPVSIDRLTQEIQQSNIVTALDYMTYTSPNLDIYFKATLSAADQATLNTLVTNHNGTPLPVNVASPVSVQSTPPFGSKTIIVSGVTHSLFARFTGLRFTANPGANTFTYTATYAWAKMLGIETVNALAGDYADLQIYDDANGTYSGVPNKLLNQFAFSINLAPNYYNRMAQFDADLYVGMVVQINYNSSATLLQGARTIGINLLMNEVK